MAKTVADALVERLIDWGVDTIFGFPGDGVNGLFEALRTHQERIRFIQVRHEEAAAFAACGYAKYTGRLGVCIATSGPGGIHLLNGLYDAKFDGQPVLAITGHTFHDLIGTKYQQDVDLDRLYMDVAVYSERVMGPMHVTSVVDEAIKAALRDSGVAHVTVPKDIQDWTFNEEQKSAGDIAGHSGRVFAPPRSFPAPEQLQVAAELLNAGRRVAILAGRGCLDAREEIEELAEKLAAPIVKPLLGKGVVPDDSPYTTGGIGLLGTGPSQDALVECDALLIAGSSFPYLEFYPKPGQAKTVQIDVDPTRIGLRTPVDVGLVGDCRRVLRGLLPLVQRNGDRSFLATAQKRMQQWNEVLEVRGTREDVPLKPQVVTYHLSPLLPEDAIICCDTGTVTTWGARYIKMRGTMMFSASGTLATMANALPYSIAAAVGNPGRRVICLVGDGGLSMLMGDLATLVKYKLPVTVIVFKNNVLGEIKWEQLVLEGNPQFGVQLQPVDFAAIARGFGLRAATVDRPEQVQGALADALSSPGPALIEAVVDPNEPPLPGKISTEQAWHFAKALARGEKDRWKIIKTVVEDKVREVV